MRFLHLIKYIDFEGNMRQFRLISEIQNYCRELGYVLGVRVRLDEFDTLKEQCEKILHMWLVRGDGMYSVTWGGLLQALKDAELGGVAKRLEEALTLARVARVH